MSSADPSSKGVIDDSQRARGQSSHGFDISLEQLMESVNLYKSRKFDEEITYIDQTLGGTQGVIQKLKSDADRGIPNTKEDHDKRDATFGSNYKEPPKRTAFCVFFKAALDDFMLKILLVCACISIGIEMGFAKDEHHRSLAWIEGTAIFIAVFVVSSVGAYNDWAKDAQFVKLQLLSASEQKVFVLRDGKEVEEGYNNIKVGDVCKIRTGMDIPVDGIILYASGVQVSEAAMTGESNEMKKDSLASCIARREEKVQENAISKAQPTAHSVPSPIMLSGTQVTTGEGFFVVTVVGENSAIGQIMKTLETEIEATPLQEKLEAIASDIGKLGMYAALLTVHVLYLRFFIEAFIDRGMDFKENSSEYLKTWLDALIVGITIIVVAVPEGLPLAVMISLAFSVKKMLIDKNFVKRLASCEIMGGANNICSDKTGTLTQNKMNVAKIWVGDIKSLESEANLKGKFAWSEVTPHKHVQQLISEGLTCNTNGTLAESSATDKSMLLFMDGIGVNIEQMRDQHLQKGFTRFQFDSKRKKSSTILENVENSPNDYKKRIHMKGASEIVLGNCTHYLDNNGERQDIDDSIKQKLLQTIETFAKEALRTICVAYKDLSPNEGGPTHSDEAPDGIQHEIEVTGMTCICILGIMDVIRPEVPLAVKQCKSARIIVRMVTGDNKTTATAIAKKCNIYDDKIDESLQIMEGPVFYEKVGGLYCKTCMNACPCDCKGKDVKESVKNKDEFEIVRKNLRVLARSRPEDKYLMVTGLRECDDVVAVTGDGTNDAPALKKADVGFAMGIAGTDVAKHAADIILMDDNFSSIVKACMWGRNIYDNIRRFLQFQLTVNVVALISAFIGACILKESPLQPIQLLWVNLIMDSLASLALATEPPTEALLNRDPQRRDEYIVSNKMVKHILGMAVYQCIVVFGIIFVGEKFIPESVEKYRFGLNADGTLKIPFIQSEMETIADKCGTNLPDGNNGSNIFPGRLYDWENNELYACYVEAEGASRHFSVVFTAFVYMQVFNMINARKIHDELNICAGIHRNALFIIIWLMIAVMQFFISQYTGQVFSVHRDGLDGPQWGISLIFGAGTFIVDFILKFIPDRYCPELGKKKLAINDDPTNVLNLKRKRTDSMQLRNRGMQRADSGR